VRSLFLSKEDVQWFLVTDDGTDSHNCGLLTLTVSGWVLYPLWAH